MCIAFLIYMSVHLFCFGIQECQSQGVPVADPAGYMLSKACIYKGNFALGSSWT